MGAINIIARSDPVNLRPSQSQRPTAKEPSNPAIWQSQNLAIELSAILQSCISAVQATP
jgi:hypothetical protein